MNLSLVQNIHAHYAIQDLNGKDTLKNTLNWYMVERNLFLTSFVFKIRINVQYVVAILNPKQNYRSILNLPMAKKFL